MLADLFVMALYLVGWMAAFAVPLVSYKVLTSHNVKIEHQRALNKQALAFNDAQQAVIVEDSKRRLREAEKAERSDPWIPQS